MDLLVFILLQLFTTLRHAHAAAGAAAVLAEETVRAGVLFQGGLVSHIP